MTPRQLLLLFSSDPCATGRVAEGVRLAAGLNASQEIQVISYLQGGAIKALAPDAFGVIDADVLLQNWPLAASAKHPVLIQQGGLQPFQIQEPAVPCHEVKPEEFAPIAETCDWVVHWDAGLGPTIFTREIMAKLGCPTGRHPLILKDSKSPDGLPARFELAESLLDYPGLLEALFHQDRPVRL